MRQLLLLALLPAGLRGTSVALPAIEIGSRDGIRLAALRARDSSLLDNSLLIGYDPGGSVRQLTEATGAVTDTYSHDAFGNTIGRTGTTMNPYQYRGEQFDSALGSIFCGLAITCPGPEFVHFRAWAMASTSPL